MKKSILILTLAMTILSCSNDDGNSCQQKKDEIHQYYDQQIEYVMNHPGPGGVDYTQIELLNQERNIKLAEACN